MKAIRYYSTNLKSEHIDFGKALLKGIAPDKGLYMPDKIPSFTQEEFAGLKDKPYHEIAKAVLFKFLSEEISADELSDLA
ncbi:MAG: threonine synthase, partial [Odoribacter sp.]|nr:threonine synthase [Odoribacter sp.]